MSASAEQALNEALYNAKAARIDLGVVVKREREATVNFMDEALRNGWGWARIGEALGVTAGVARHYYTRNRRHVRGV